MTYLPPEIAEQIRHDGANEINSLIKEHFNVNLVTCGNCGLIFEHNDTTLNRIDDELICPHCHAQDDPCHFPDLFY